MPEDNLIHPSEQVPVTHYMLRCLICRRRYSSPVDEIACEDCRANPAAALIRRRRYKAPWLEALPSGITCFPVRVTAAAEKKPLVKWRFGHLNSRDGWDWNRHWARKDANAVGVPGGRATGLACIDLDEHRPDYQGAALLSRWNLPRTREHQTGRGGRHLIFHLPAGHRDLPNRQNLAQGVDVRGEGGYWVWAGVGYQVISDRPMAVLPEAVCAEIKAGHTPSTPKTAAWASITGEAAVPALDRLEAILAHEPEAALTRLWLTGEKAEGDTSASGRQHSAAAMLIARRFSPGEVEWLLLNAFPYGQVGSTTHPLSPDMELRSVQRSVAGAIEFHAQQRRDLIARAFGR